MANWKLRKDKAPADASDPSDASGTVEAAAPAERRGMETQEPEHQAASLPPLDAGMDFTELRFDGDPKESDLDDTHPGDGLTLVDYSDNAPDGSSLAAPAHQAQAYDAPVPDFEAADFEAADFEPSGFAKPNFEPSNLDAPSFETSDFEPPVFAMPPPIEAAAPVEMAAPVMEAAPTEAMPLMQAMPSMEAMPLMQAMPPVIPTDEAGDFQQRLRTGRFEASELAPPPSGFSTPGIPSVSPFVLDAPPPAAPPEAPPQLVVHFGRLAAAFPVSKDVTTIGRPDSALHYYPDVEVELDDAVSRRHAEVVKRGTDYYIVDTGSTNGTRLNGEALQAHEERRLTRGDRIKVGERTEIVFG